MNLNSNNDYSCIYLLMLVHDPSRYNAIQYTRVISNCVNMTANLI